MKSIHSLRFYLLSLFTLLLSGGAFGQSKHLETGSKATDAILGQSLLAHKPLLSNTIAAGCDDDQIAPVVTCPPGSCLPTARAAYLTSTYGEPWGFYDNINAMNAVFGGGNWDAFYLDNVDATTLLTPNYKVIFLEGSSYGGYALNDFVTTNLTALENWVAAGGALFINCATTNGPSSIDFGFGGVMFQSSYSGYNGYVQVTTHPIFNGPFMPANGDFYGNQFFYGVYSGNTGQTLLSDNAIALTEKTWGAGKVIFGCIIPPSWDGPQPNVMNMWQNILAYLDEVCGATLVLTADQGTCMATVTGQTWDATATDDCVLAALTHDFAAAPTNTTLNGAVFPVGATLVRWTATDDAGNTATCEFYVAVQEPVEPLIACPDNISVNADPNACGATVGFTVTATDNCTATPTIAVSTASGSIFPNGITILQASATDMSNNRSTCSFSITIAANPELCNGLDDDCNGLTDDGAPADNTFYADADYDYYGNPLVTIMACFAPYGYVDNALDCNDANYYIHPGMYEYCNDIDENCDGNIDQDVSPTWYADTDEDGYGNPNASMLACSQPMGYVYDNTDCDDANRYIRPGAPEDCTNLVDENCDGNAGTNAFTIAETHMDVFCGSNPDGSIEITMSPAQYYPLILWSNGVYGATTQSNLQNGTYKVTVTNECGTSKSKTIKILPSTTPPLEVKMTGTHLKCSGDANGMVTATPSKGCAGYTYAWSTGGTNASLTGISGGTYSVIVTDGCGCTQSGIFSINEPGPLSLYVNTVILLLDGKYWVQVIPYGGTAPYKFRRTALPTGFTPWSNSNGFGNVAPGSYTFEVRDKNGCTAQTTYTLQPLAARTTEGVASLDSQDADLSSPTGIRQEITEQTMQPFALYPNPTHGVLNLEWAGYAQQAGAIQIVNIAGQSLRQIEVPTGSVHLLFDLSDLPDGIYFAKILVGKEQIKVLRFEKL